MIPKRLRYLLILVATLLLVPLANGAKSIVSASATISGSGTSYRLTVRNTGDEPLKCVGLLLDGVQPTAATGPPGVLTRVGTFQGRGLVHMQAQANDVVAPGATVTVDFITNVPIATNAGGELRYSSTCAVGSDVIGRATGPAPPPPPPPCTCKNLDGEISRARRAKSKPPGTRTFLSFRLTWTMECRDGSGRCQGELSVRPPRKYRRDVVGGDLNITCTGPCEQRRTGLRDLIFSSGRPDTAERSVVVRVQVECGRKSERAYTIVFRDNGKGVDVADPKKSDLNGNRVPDGREKK